MHRKLSIAIIKDPQVGWNVWSVDHKGIPEYFIQDGYLTKEEAFIDLPRLVEQYGLDVKS